METIEEHNEKELIDRVGLDKAEEIVEEEQEEKEGAEMALQIEKEEEEKKKREEEEAEARRRIEEEEEDARRKKEEEKKEVLERERREMEEMERAKEDAKEDEEKKESLEEEAKKQSEESESSRDDRNNNNINLGEEPEHFSEKTKEGSYVRATSHYGLSWSPPAPTAPPRLRCTLAHSKDAARKPVTYPLLSDPITSAFSRGRPRPISQHCVPTSRGTSGPASPLSAARPGPIRGSTR